MRTIDVICLMYSMHGEKVIVGGSKLSIKTIRLKTLDDCDISLHRTVQKSLATKHPILLVHGFAANAQMWRSPVQEIHLADILSRQGHPVYAIDLRFRKGKPTKDWDADDYVFFDIPRALSYIEHDSGKSGIHWIGHSMGGLLGYMYQALNGSDKVISHTTLGSPGFSGAGAHSHWIKLPKILVKIASSRIQTGRLDLLPPEIMSALLKFSFFTANPRNPFLKKQNLRGFKSRNFLGNVSQGECLQMGYLAHSKGLKSTRFRFSYDQFWNRVKAPLLAFAGDRDFIVPPQVAKIGFDSAPSIEKKYYRLSKSRGSRTSYGHLDLIMGPNVGHEIWPKIISWIQQWEKAIETPKPQRLPPFSFKPHTSNRPKALAKHHTFTKMA